MGLMDKLKLQAEQVAARAQEGTAQVQAKLDQVQAQRATDLLLRDLGIAYYAEQRKQGPHDAVERALAALDGRSGSGGAIDVSVTEPAPPGPTAPTSAAPAQDFKLDDL
ncbi:MAG TPA: hypothetical protein VNF75_07135 [Candidatus Dormibacteraeota bacterium]|nr:hypothetical protein [Candidatus Dormibacteraeota bacterium]HVD03891.1 hypothetical protein [Candidatus Dormibacteraeota bacterium]